LKVSVPFLILNALITLVFVGAVTQKITGKVAPSWERWGFSRHLMYATATAELGGLLLFWWPGLELIGAAALVLVLVGALGTLAKHREGAAHMALPALTLILVLVRVYLSSFA
jgi:hypothetical protein